MLNDLRTCFLGRGGTRDDLRATPAAGDPLTHLAMPMPKDGRLDPAAFGAPAKSASTGDSEKLSRRLGVDEHVRLETPLPNWKAGNKDSRLFFSGSEVVEKPLVRVRPGLCGRLRLRLVSDATMMGISLY